MATTTTANGDAPRYVPPVFKRRLTRCLCRGAMPSLAPLSAAERYNHRAPIDDEKRHPVWIALLEYDNDVYERERWLVDYYILPMNRLTVWWSGWPFIHCQIVFWNALEKKYYTYSSDHRRGVSAFDEKTFARGWRWIRLSVSERQELAMHNFLVAQLGKPMNALGQYMAWTWFPASGCERRWFCSELITRVLQEGGVILDTTVQPESTWPHNLYLYLLQQCAYLPRPTLQEANPISVTDFHRLIDQHHVQLPLPLNNIAASIVSTMPPMQRSARSTPPPPRDSLQQLQIQRPPPPPLSPASQAPTQHQRREPSPPLPAPPRWPPAIDSSYRRGTGRRASNVFTI